MVSAMSGCAVTSALVLLIKMAAVHGGTVDTARGAETFTIYPGVGRYVYYPGPSNWTNAHKVCSTSSGHLAVADSKEEGDVLFEVIKANSASSPPITVHVGYHTRYQGGEYVTVRGQPLSKSGFQNVTAVGPSSGYDMNCGALYVSTTVGYSGLLLDSPCDRTQPFICEFRLWDDYDLIPGFGYYKLHKGARYWHEAEYTCRTEGGYLLVVNSDLERTAVANKYTTEVSGGHIWYGAHQMFAYALFVTIFDEPLVATGFSTWFTGYPAGRTYPHMALHFELASMDNNLELYPATEQFPFICKHDLHDLM